MGLVLMMGFASPTHAAAAASPNPNGFSLNLKDVDIRAFIEQVASITGENFIVDPAVKGTITVISPSAMSKEAVNEVFLSVLRVNGFAAVASENATRIVPLATNKGTASSGTARANSQQIITRVVAVKNANIEEAVKLLKPLVSPAGYLEGSATSNALIVSDYADNVAQVMKSLQGLDRPGGGEVEIIPLKEAWVGNIVPLIETLSPVQLADSKSRNRLRVVADERSNSIIVRGDVSDRQAIRRLVETLDKKVPSGSDIQLIRLQYADAREVAGLLRRMLSNGGGAGGGAVANSPTAAAAVNAGSANGGNAAGANLFATALGNASAGANGASGQVSDGGDGSIQADVALNALVVRAEPARMNEIRALVRQLDVRRPQVLIEAAIVEVTSDQSRQLGVQLAGGGVAEKIAAGTTQFSATGLPISSVLAQLGSAQSGAVGGEGLAIALGVKDSFDVVIRALASTAGVNLLSTPSITTLDNAEARIVVGQNVPFRTGSFSTLNAGVGNPFTTIERQDIGVTLRVLPQIHEGNLVRLTIAQEVSSIAPTQTTGAADLITNKRTIETKILAEDGETIVLGGLIQDDVTETVSKVPLLGDIPLLGALFRNTSSANTKRNLVVFLRPTVLNDRLAAGRVTQGRYQQIYDVQLLQPSSGLGDHAPRQAPDASTIFTPPAKRLPPLVPTLEPTLAPSETPPPATVAPVATPVPEASSAAPIAPVIEPPADAATSGLGRAVRR